LDKFVDLDYGYMTTDLELKAQTRSERDDKAKKVREAGFVPANVYGPGAPNKNIKIKEIDFKHIFDIAGESHLINLVIDGEPTVKVIVKDVQKDPTRDKVIHVDFYRVDMKKKITTEIPLNFIGEPKAVKELGGTLVKNMDSAEIRCLPGDLVDKIDVDLSGLNTFDDCIRMSDLKLPPGLELVGETNETVASVVEPAKEEEIIEEKEEVEEGAPAEEKEAEEEEKEEKGEKKSEDEGEKREESNR
jgi:large subunit ribosomal protein L25